MPIVFRHLQVSITQKELSGNLLTFNLIEVEMVTSHIPSILVIFCAFYFQNVQMVQN